MKREHWASPPHFLLCSTSLCSIAPGTRRSWGDLGLAQVPKGKNRGKIGRVIYQAQRAEKNEDCLGCIGAVEAYISTHFPRIALKSWTADINALLLPLSMCDSSKYMYGATLHSFSTITTTRGNVQYST